MRRIAVLLVVIGLALAAVSSVGVFYLLDQTSRPAPATPTPMPMAKVVVAAKQIPERTAMTDDMLTIADWPQHLLPAGALTSTKDAVGAVTSSPLASGEIVLVSKIAGEVEKIGLAPVVPPGLVTMALALPPVSAAAGALQDGDSVDVLISLEYSTYNDTGDESKPLYVTFYSIQDVQVLHVGGAQPSPTPGASDQQSSAALSRASGGQNSPILITLMVTPQDALLIKYARERGTVDLVLRSQQFHDQVVTDPVYLEYIMRRFDLPRPVIIHQAQPTPGAQR